MLEDEKVSRSVATFDLCSTSPWPYEEELVLVCNVTVSFFRFRHAPSRWIYESAANLFEREQHKCSGCDVKMNSLNYISVHLDIRVY